MITDEAAQKLRILFATSGWNDVIHVAGQQRAKEALRVLAMNPDERKESGGQFKNKTDDQLRQIMAEADWYLLGWRNELTVYDMNRQREELSRQQNGPGMAPEPIGTPGANP